MNSSYLVARCKFLKWKLNQVHSVRYDFSCSLKIDCQLLFWQDMRIGDKIIWWMKRICSNRARWNGARWSEESRLLEMSSENYLNLKLLLQRLGCHEGKKIPFPETNLPCKIISQALTQLFISKHTLASPNPIHQLFTSSPPQNPTYCPSQFPLIYGPRLNQAVCGTANNENIQYTR